MDKFGDVNKVERDVLGSIKQKLETDIKNATLPEDSVKKGVVIYVVPRIFRELKPSSYTPYVVSIGPVHSQLGSSTDTLSLDIQGLKRGYMKSFLSVRTRRRRENFIRDVIGKEQEIRDSYGKKFPELRRETFVEMILLDSFFILELFMRNNERTKWEHKDPLMSGDFLEDLVVYYLRLLENQLPFFILDLLYTNAGVNISESFLDLSMKFFEPDNCQLIDSSGGYRPAHFTDMIRRSMLPPNESLSKEGVDQTLYSVSRFCASGGKLELSKETTVLDIKFQKEKGVLTLPAFVVEDSSESLWRNILAFEQLHYSSAPYIAGYIWMLSLLIKNEGDVRLLADKKIIVDFVGDDNAVCMMIKSLALHLHLGKIRSEYRHVCQELNAFCEKASNKNNLAKERMKQAITTASIVTAISTVVQGFCTVLQTIWQRKG